MARPPATAARAALAPALVAAGPAGAADCTATVIGVTDTGRWLEHSYDAARGAMSTQRTTDPTLPFTPTAMVASGGARDMQSWVGTYWATDESGTLHQLTRTVDRVGGVSANRHDWTVVATDFGATRDLTWSYPYLFQLTPDGLVRHAIHDNATGPQLGEAVQVPGEWGQAATVTVARRAKLGDSTRYNATVLLATRISGGLFEVTVPDATPTRTTVDLLHPSALPDLRSLSVSPCGAGGRLLVTVDTDGAVRVLRDRRADDGSGTDLTGGAAAPVATGWRDTTYGG